MEVKEIYWLKELSKEHNDLVGKKCANLGELTKLGLKVPYGFALSIKAYEHFMTATGLKEEVEKIVENERGAGLDIDKDVDKMIELSGRIRAAIEEDSHAARSGRSYRRLLPKAFRRNAASWRWRARSGRAAR